MKSTFKKILFLGGISIFFLPMSTFAVGSYTSSVGSMVTVIWGVDHANSCTLSSDYPAASGMGSIGSYLLTASRGYAFQTLSQTTAGASYTISCFSPTYSTWISDVATLYVTPSAVPTATLTITPASGPAGNVFNMSWSANNSPTSYQYNVNGGAFVGVGMQTTWSGVPGNLSLVSGVNTISVRGCNALGCGPATSKTYTVVSTPVVNLYFSQLKEIISSFL